MPVLSTRSSHPLRRCLVVLSCVVCCGAAWNSSAAPSGAAPIGELDRFFYEVLQSPDVDTIDPEAAWEVEDLSIELDGLELTFTQGVFHPRVAAEGEVFGAIYLGTGRWVFEPGDEAERAELERMTGATEIDSSFTHALLQFSPQYLSRLQGEALPIEVNDDDATRARQLWHESRDRQRLALRDSDLTFAWSHAIEDADLDVFRIDAALIESASSFPPADAAGGRTVYSWSARRSEQVALYRYWPLPQQDRPWWRARSDEMDEAATQRLCSFVAADERGTQSRLQWALAHDASIDVEHYRAEFEVEQLPDREVWQLVADVQVSFRPTEAESKAVLFDLAGSDDQPDRLLVETVLDAGDATLPFVHRDGLLVVELPEPAAAGSTTILRVRYRGQLLREASHRKATAARAGSWLKNLELTYTGWFPVNAGDRYDDYTWEWTIRTPTSLQAVASGTTVDDLELDDHRVLRVEETVPAHFAGIVFGRFKVFEDPSEQAPRIRVFAHKGQLQVAGKLLDASRGIVQYYESIHGVPYPYAELDVVQGPIGISHSVAPPGLIHLDGMAYMDAQVLADLHEIHAPQYAESVLPHEIAHQWWAHTLKVRTPHDRWLMEAGAEYAAALYCESSARPNQQQREYLTFIYHWQERRHGADPAWTVPLHKCFLRWGPRTRWATVYGRGPLLFHDLRSRLGRDAWIDALHAVFQARHGQRICTEEFKQELQTATGMSFERYFEEYVYGHEALTRIPVEGEEQ